MLDLYDISHNLSWSWLRVISPMLQFIDSKNLFPDHNLSLVNWKVMILHTIVVHDPRVVIFPDNNFLFRMWGYLIKIAVVLSYCQFNVSGKRHLSKESLRKIINDQTLSMWKWNITLYVLWYILVKISKLPLDFVNWKYFCGLLYRKIKS